MTPVSPKEPEFKPKGLQDILSNGENWGIQRGHFSDGTSGPYSMDEINRRMNKDNEIKVPFDPSKEKIVLKSSNGEEVDVTKVFFQETK
jgi:hypothetical protein